jgi:hypothetical protein
MMRNLGPSLVALVGAGVLGWAAPAAAACATPSWLGTPEGVAVPARGVMYRFDGETAHEVWYDARGDAELRLDDGWGQRRFPVDDAWRAPVQAPRVLTMERSTLALTCSSEDALAIQIDQPVAAVRVFWSTGDFRGETIVVPRPTETPTGMPAALLLLGKIGCAGETVPVADLERGVVLGLTAIRHDGSEVPIDKVPTIVDLDEVSTSPRRARAVAILDRTGTAVMRAAPVRRAIAPWAGALPLILVVGAVVIGVRRGRAAAQPPEVLPRATARRR